MDVQVLGQKEFRELAAKFKRASNGKVVRAALTKRMRAEAKPIVGDLQKAILGVDSKGVGGGGTKRRAASHAVRAKRPRAYDHGLRASIARGVKSRVKYSGFSVGLRLYVDVSRLPNKQRKLPFYIDSPAGWRHPVFGNRDNWVQQFGQPWFYVTCRRDAPRVRGGLVAAVNDALKELQ